MPCLWGRDGGGGRKVEWWRESNPAVQDGAVGNTRTCTPCREQVLACATISQQTAAGEAIMCSTPGTRFLCACGSLNSSRVGYNSRDGKGGVSATAPPGE